MNHNAERFIQAVTFIYKHIGEPLTLMDVASSRIS
jgi:hypothetical protein